MRPGHNSRVLCDRERRLAYMAADAKNAAIFLAALLLYMGLMNVLFGTSCPTVILVGLPCPGCGITRAFKLLMSGRVWEAFCFQPLLFLLAALAVLYAVQRYAFGRPRAFERCAVIFIAAAVPLYIYRMAVWFPKTEPMVYEPDNVLAYIRLLLHQ